MNIFRSKTYLAIEFILLFFGIPLLIVFDWKLIHPSTILLPSVTLVIVLLVRNKNFQFKELISFSIPKKIIKINLLIILIVAILLFVGVYLFSRENLFNLPRGNYLIWIVLLIFYPIFSAYMQEIVYRFFLFKRYQNLFANRWLIIMASGTVFSFVHIVYFNILSLILTFILGIYLAYMYDKTKSVLFTAGFHGICGDIIFTIGLGQYFWMDMYKFLK